MAAGAQVPASAPLTRIGAVRAIQPLQTSLANNQIIAHLKSDDNDIRAACAIALGFAGNGGSVSSLIAALHDADGDIGTAAVDALASIGEPAIEPLVAVLKSNQDQALYAAEALAKIGMPSFEALKTLAGSASPVSQRWAAVALGEMGIAEGLQVLTTLSQSNNEEVAFVAKDQLARLGKVQ